MQFSPNGSFFVLGREDGTLGRLWNPLATPVVLSLSMIAAQSDGIRSLAVHNPSRSRFVSHETSADLQHWTALTNRITSALEFEIIDATSTGAPFRFYRANAPE